mgnify:CR=1 FL=1
MSFAQALERLRDAARIEPKNDWTSRGHGERRIVSREDLAELVQMFDSIDQARRQCIADLERHHSALTDEAKRNLVTLDIRGEICQRLFDTLPKTREYIYSERYGTHVYTLSIKRLRASTAEVGEGIVRRASARKEDGHGG